MSVFKSYDVRGIYGTELTAELAYQIGVAYAHVVESNIIVVGQDARLSSKALAQALIKGLSDAGKKVHNLGLCTTPMLHFATQETAGVMVTASHNPKEFNGFKFYETGVIPLGLGTGLEKIEFFTTHPPKSRRKKGTITKTSIMDKYVKHVVSFAGPIRKDIHIVADLGNGSEGVIFSKITKALGLSKVTILHEKPDGKFPAHEPNPYYAKNTKDIEEGVRTHHADLGVAFDGDADRIAFFTESGNRVRSDHALVLIARQVFAKRKGFVTYDLRSSWVVREELRRLGCESMITKVGHTNVYTSMKATRATLGGEVSGHFYFRDNFFADSGDIAFVLFLSYLSAANAPLSELIRPLDRYKYSGEISVRVTDKELALTRIFNEVREMFRDAKIDFLDGISFNFKDWWFNIRKSNTESLVRLVVEARDARLLDKRVKLLKRIILQNK